MKGLSGYEVDTATVDTATVDTATVDTATVDTATVDTATPTETNDTCPICLEEGQQKVECTICNGCYIHPECLHLYQERHAGPILCLRCHNGTLNSSLENESLNGHLQHLINLTLAEIQDNRNRRETERRERHFRRNHTSFTLTLFLSFLIPALLLLAYLIFVILTYVVTIILLFDNDDFNNTVCNNNENLNLNQNERDLMMTYFVIETFRIMTEGSLAVIKRRLPPGRVSPMSHCMVCYTFVLFLAYFIVGVGNIFSTAYLNYKENSACFTLMNNSESLSSPATVFTFQRISCIINTVVLFFRFACGRMRNRQ